MRLLIAITVFSSFFGAAFFSVDLGFFQLTPFRVSLLLLMIFWLYRNPKIEKNTIFNKRTLFLLFWLVYNLITVLWVEDITRWAKSEVFISIGFLCTIIFLSLLKEFKDYVLIFLSIEIAAVIYSVFGWYEIITSNYLFYEPENSYLFNVWETLNKNAPVFISSNENEYAVLMVFMFFISYIFSKVRKYKVISRVIMVSEILLVLKTESRGAIIALIIGILIIFLLDFSKKWKDTYLKKLILPVLILIPLIILIFMWNSGTISLKFYEGSSDSFRIQLILAGLTFLVQTALLGVGGGNIEYWMYHYAPEVSGGTYANIHSWWAEILVGFGVFVFVGYLFYYFGIFKDLIKKYKEEKDDKKRAINIGIIAFMTAFIITSMVSSSLLRSEWLWLWWGVVVAYLYNYNKTKVAQ